MSFKAVVVGAGGISGAWLPNLKAEGVDVAGIVDINPAQAQAQADKFELEPLISDDLESTLKKVKPDFVVDLTPPDYHCATTCTALGAGCHVIGEKPMASSMDEARKMVRAAEEAGKIYMVSQSRRYEAAHAALTEELNARLIGSLTTMNCAFYIGAHFGGFRDEMESPLILDMAIHHFDLARMMSGADPIAVYAKEFNPRGSWYAGDVAASCIFEMSDNLVFTYTGSWCAEGMHTSWHGDWRFIGTKGTVMYERDAKPIGEVLAGDTGFHRPMKQIAIEPTPVAQGQLGAIKEFLAAINGGPAPQGECHDNIKSLAMVFAAMESSRKGQRIPVVW
ncbi:MAG: Gfo/Idh/MocA family oxidoreductase [Lentisphaerae bacterium]|jgi:predicted dehydrogenase|nr:Gfo/Idh/MocA family oxidoreductase [Lentisphaerota bacterium]